MKMTYVLVKSGLPSIEGAYLGQFVSNGTTELDVFATKICANRPAVDEPELKLALRALAVEIREQVGENHYRVNAGVVSFEPAISGSLPSMDAALGPENELYVNMLASDAVRRDIGKIVPTRGSANAVKVTIDAVEDLASHEKSIVGTREFVITGFNLSARQDGEGLSLLKLNGTLATAVTVKDEDGMGQRVNAQLSSSVTTGNYLLQLTTHGYATPDAAVESYTKKVQVVGGDAPEPVEPEVTKVTSPAGEGVLKVGESLTIEGVGLGAVTGVMLQYRDSTGETSLSVDCSCTVESPQKVNVARVPELPDADFGLPVEVDVLDAEGTVLSYLEVAAQA